MWTPAASQISKHSWVGLEGFYRSPVLCVNKIVKKNKTKQTTARQESLSVVEFGAFRSRGMEK